MPAVIKPCLHRSGTGSKTFGVPIEIKCYAEGKITVVTDNTGKEVVSNTSLYVDGDTAISPLDNIIFEGRDNEIKAITNFYRNGKIDLRVVYI